MSPSEQERQRVDVRAVWPHEALDFTPWLAQNLELGRRWVRNSA